MEAMGYYKCECGEEYFSDFPYEKARCLGCGAGLERKELCYMYGNYHFVPHGKLEPVENFAEYVLEQDCELGFFDSDRGGLKMKFPYSHSGFYAAMGDVDQDVFRCIENGYLYVPCEHELFLFTGYRRKGKVVELAQASRLIIDGEYRGNVVSYRQEQKEEAWVFALEGEGDISVPWSNISYFTSCGELNVITKNVGKA